MSYAIYGGWMIFASIFLTRRKTPRQKESKRDPRAKTGMMMQGASFAMAWLQRPRSSNFLSFGESVEIVVAAFALTLMIASLLLTNSAVRTLGRQWSLGARLIEGHQLVTQGPYGLVRHPIYVGLLGMLLATGLVLGRFVLVVPAVALYVSGTILRTRVEERLLADAFGITYEQYAARVPALFPRLRRLK